MNIVCDKHGRGPQDPKNGTAKVRSSRVVGAGALDADATACQARGSDQLMRYTEHTDGR